MSKLKSNLSAIFFVITTLLFVLSTNIYALEVTISGNSEGSENSATVSIDQITTVQQSNNADIENNVVAVADTGGNDIRDTTGGVSDITTGDVLEEVSVENALNISSVDIGCCGQAEDVKIAANGTGSQNTVNLQVMGNTTVVTKNEANIANDVNGSANTGDNKITDSSGDVSIKTGDIAVSGKVSNSPVNIVNVNGGGGGNNISLSVDGNADGSSNQINYSADYSSNINMSSIYDAQTKVNWDLNSGGNEVEDPMGDVNILTGDIIFDFIVKNGPININNVDWDCCGNEPYDPGESDSGGDETIPDEPGRDGNDSQPASNDNNSASSSSSSDSSSGSGGIGSILGLSDTSSKEARSLLFVMGLLFMASGLSIVGKEALQL